MVSKRNEYSQGKLRLYTHLKVRPGSEQYLDLGNPKLRQSITKSRISEHKFPTEIGRFENKAPPERICPLCCEGIGDVSLTKKIVRFYRYIVVL